MALQYLFDPNKQFQSRNGVNAVNGFLRVYLNGTDDRATTYRNFDGGLNEPDIVLDTDGRAVVIVDDTKTYRLEVYNRLGGLMWTVSNYKARGGSGGSGKPVSVEGTAGEIDVDENTEGGVKHFVVGLAATIKNAISSLTSAVNGLALSLGNKKERQTPKEFFGSTTKTLVGITQDENGVITVTYSAIAFPDWTDAITAATDLCEKLANKKTTFSGFETSDTYYPTLKAVVEYLDGRLQNLGGKKITNNGVPFTTASQLPTTTPYYGQSINSDDYAYVQDTGIASRYTAIVTGSSVAWSLDYEIALPVFTAEQQAAIDSGVTAEMLGTFLTKTGDGSNVTATFTSAGSRTNISTGEKLSTIFGKIAKWFADLKSVAFSGSYNDLSNKPTIPAAANNGTLTIKQNGTSKGTFSANQSTDSEINVTDTTYESKPEASGGTAVSLVTTGEKYTWNHKQNSLPTSGTPSSTFAINVSGTANKANYLIRAYVNKSTQTTKIWKKIATSKTFTSWDSGSICFLYNHSGYQNELGLDSIVSVTIHTGDAGSLSNARIYTYSYRSASETQLVRKGSTNQYEVWVKVPNTDTNMYATILNSYGAWTINTDDSQTGQLTDDEFTAYKSSNPSVGTDYNYNIAKASKLGVGSTRLPIFADANGMLSPMNIDEYYCWAQPTTQWTDVMEIALYGIQNQCNNECIGSVKRINLTSSHPSLCYLRVNLPELQGAGRYRFTLEFEITNSNGQNLTEAYGVLILVPPTGYSGETFLSECAYDSSGRAQSSVMNQIHVPPQGSTYRHKLYVDGHTYRVVKTK
jgi:hypothetical protein